MKILALILTTLTAASLSLRAADVTGKWKSEFDTTIGAMKYTFDLKSDAGKITGKATRDRDGEKTETELKEGKLTGEDVSFVEIVNIQDQDIRIEYKGKVAGDEMKLTRTVGDFGSTDIVAKRDQVVTVAGKWSSEFETQVGAQKYNFEFKVTGDKLTGKATRTLGDAKTETEIKEGKVTGVDVSFVETLKNQDQEIRVEYKGKLAGDELKLTRKVGDIATTDIVAKRVKESAPGDKMMMDGK